jgi:hypothetical protein
MGAQAQLVSPGYLPSITSKAENNIHMTNYLQF